MVVVDGTGRVPWLDGDPRVRRRVDRPTFEEGTRWTEAIVETNTIGTARAIDHASKSSRPSSSSPSSTRRGARRRRSTTQTAARCSARSTRAGRDARAPDSLALAPVAADTPVSVRGFERTLSEDRPGRADPAWSTVLLASSPPSLRLLDQRRLEAQIGDRLELSRRHAENLAGDVARGSHARAADAALVRRQRRSRRHTSRAVAPAQAARQCVAVMPYRLAADAAADSLTVEPCSRPAT